MNSFVLVGILTLSLILNVSGLRLGLTGGLSSSEKDADSEVKEFVEFLSGDIRKGAYAAFVESGGETNDVPNLFENAPVTAVSYKDQVVAGMNYFVRVKVGDYFFFVSIYRDLSGTPQLSKVVGPKDISDPIEYFF